MKKYIVALFASIAAVLMFTSCSDSKQGEFAGSPLLGTWELMYVDGEKVEKKDVKVYSFDDNGTGIFGRYTNNDTFSEYAFTWDIEDSGSREVLVINLNGGIQRFTFTVAPGTETWEWQLTLTDLSTGQVLLFKSY